MKNVLSYSTGLFVYKNAVLHIFLVTISFFFRSLFGKSGGQTIKRIIEDDEIPSASTSLISASRQIVRIINIFLVNCLN